MDFAAYIPHIAIALLSAFGGLWAAFHRLDLLLKARIRENTHDMATKVDIARIEGKLDILIQTSPDHKDYYYGFKRLDSRD